MSDILSRIDDAVSSRCACGCGTQLDPAGASMWFARQDCQWRYQQQHADNPGDVYSRPDAADAWAEADEIRVPLREAARYVPGEPPPTDERPLSRPSWSDHLRVGGVDLSGHVRSAMLAPIAHPEDSVWREYLNGLPRGSITVSGFVEPMPNTRVWMNGEEITHMISGVTVERSVGSPTRIGFNGETPVARDNVRVEVEQDGATYLIDETHGRETPLQRLSTDPPARLASQARPDGYWSYEPSTAEDWIAANPTVGERVEPGAVADFAESLGLELDEWQRQMLDAVYSEPQPRLYSGRGVLTSEILNAAESRVRQSYGGEVGSILGVPIISSPLVPEGEVYLINRQPQPRVWFVSEPMRFDHNAVRWRMWAQMTPPVRPGDLLVWGDNHYMVVDEVSRKPWKRAAGWHPPRNNPRMRKLHTDYSRRRRRNR